LFQTCSGTKMGLKGLNEKHQFSPPQTGADSAFHLYITMGLM
jgi:hypothetical protein